MTTIETDSGVRLSGVGKTFAAKGDVVEALRDLHLDVAAGEFVCVVGASGCGKSTLLRLVAGFDAPTAGTVTVSGRTVHRPGPDRGVVFQDFGLFPWLTVAENIAYGPKQRGLRRREITEIVDRHLDMVRLRAFAGRYPDELSGGMKQRVSIARALANDPAVLLMDEPFGALDSLTRETLQHALQDIWSQVRPTIVFITHSVEEAVFLADRVIVMSGGPNHGVPGHISTIETVELPRTRDVTAPEFNAVKRRLLDAVHAGVRPD